MKHSHYFKDVSHLQRLDVYRLLQLFDVTDPCVSHAVKKLLCAGQRGTKSAAQDAQEAIDTLTRYQAMQQEDEMLPAPARPPSHLYMPSFIDQMAARAAIREAQEGGWVNWYGGPCPVVGGFVDVKLRSGAVRNSLAEILSWDMSPQFPTSDIIAYRTTEAV